MSAPTAPPDTPIDPDDTDEPDEPSGGARGERLRPSHFRGKTPLVFVVALTVAAGVGLLAFYRLNSAVSVLGFAAVAALHGALAALLVGLTVELVDPTATGLGGRHHLRMVAGLVVVGIGVVVVDAVVRPRLSLSPSAGRWFLVASLGATVAAALVTFLAFSKNHLAERSEKLAVRCLAALGGILLGTVSVVALVVVPALYRDWRRPHLTVDLVAPAMPGGYVALGDSYSAGEGLGPFNPWSESDTGDGCHRSVRAYAHLLRFEGGQPPLRFPACSSAVTSDVYGEGPRRGDPAAPIGPQVDDGTHPEVDLVTITIGGNDVVFSGVVKHCLFKTSCMEQWFEPPRSRRVSYPPAQPLLPWANEALDVLSENVATVYRELENSFPGARIVVLGYPHLFPADEPTLWPDCVSVLRRVSHTERAVIRDLTDQLNATLYARAVEAGIEFVSPEAAWEGHEPCGEAGQFTNSVKPMLDSAVVDNGTFHPNEDGQKQLAWLVACYLTTWPSGERPDPYAGPDHDLDLTGAVASPGAVGLVDPPGSSAQPLSC